RLLLLQPGSAPRRRGLREPQRPPQGQQPVGEADRPVPLATAREGARDRADLTAAGPPGTRRGPTGRDDDGAGRPGFPAPSLRLLAGADPFAGCLSPGCPLAFRDGPITNGP